MQQVHKKKTLSQNVLRSLVEIKHILQYDDSWVHAAKITEDKNLQDIWLVLFDRRHIKLNKPVITLFSRCQETFSNEN